MTEDSSSYNHDGWTRENHTLNFRKKGCKAVIGIVLYSLYVCVPPQIGGHFLNDLTTKCALLEHLQELFWENDTTFSQEDDKVFLILVKSCETENKNLLRYMDFFFVIRTSQEVWMFLSQYWRWFCTFLKMTTICRRWWWKLSFL